jgi:uncharacterized damage-inducible protein DinB
MGGQVMESRADTLSKAFVKQAAAHLEEDFLPKIRTCLDLLDEEEFWRRGSENENSVGNMLLHLSGNVRQWIISGLGGSVDKRERSKEFSARSAMPKGDALGLLQDTISEAVSVMKRTTTEDLLTERTIQGFRQTGLQAILHVVEHFSYHTGQIVFVTKRCRQIDLKFYDL